MKSDPIGILDSGVGGLSVFNDIQQALPNESLLAIADSGNAPYGNKSKEFITARALELTRQLLKQRAKLIVLACNTITVTALAQIRASYPETPIIGVVPVIKTAAAMTTNHKIGVLSTTTTAQSAYQKQLIEEFAVGCTVFNHGTDQIVPLIERGELEGEQLVSVLKPILHRFQKEEIDTLALGCTHFPLVKKQIEAVLVKKVSVLDSGGAIARQVKRVLTQKQLIAEDTPQYRVVTSGDPVIAKKIIAATMDPAIVRTITIATFSQS